MGKAHSIGVVVGVCLILGAGCATIEYASEPDLPAIQVSPAAAKHAEDLSAVLPAEAPAAPVSESGALELSVENAVAMALENNQALQVERIGPALAATRIAEARAQFDPGISAALERSRQRAERDTSASWPLAGFALDNAGAQTLTEDLLLRGEAGAAVVNETSSFGIEQFFPTGTALGLGVSHDWSRTDNFVSLPGAGSPSDELGEEDSVQLSFTQQLLRGRGLKVNLTTLRSAQLAALSSEYALRGFIEDLVAQVENTFWDYTLAERQIAILENSLAVAERQMTEIEERIRVGTLAESERAAPEAEVAQRRSSLIDGRSRLAQLRLTLMRLLNPSDQALRSQAIRTSGADAAPGVELLLPDRSVSFAQRLRPELNQTRLLLAQDNLAVVRTKNGVLPQLELFLNLAHSSGRTSYTDSFAADVRGADDSATSASAGARMSYALGNRAARAQFQRARLQREQHEGALDNLAQLIEQDVRGAYVEQERAREQTTATAATRRLQEVVAQTEAEKFRVGNSTALLLAQAQRDLLAAEISEAQALVNYRKALVNLYRLEGSLLLRRGIDCPGVPMPGEDRPEGRILAEPVRAIEATPTGR